MLVIVYGLQRGFREGVFGAECPGRPVGALEGEAGRRLPGLYCSTRLMNWSGVKGEPGEDVDFNDRGLWPLGVINEKDGKKGPFGSGVRGGPGGDTAMSAEDSNVLELIHFSS